MTESENYSWKGRKDCERNNQIYKQLSTQISMYVSSLTPEEENSARENTKTTLEALFGPPKNDYETQIYRGYNQVEIANQRKVTKSAVNAYFDRHPESSDLYWKARDIFKLEKQKVKRNPEIDGLVEQKLSAHEIAEKIDQSHKSVYSYLRADKEVWNNYMKKQEERQEDQESEILAEIKQGLNRVEISRKHGKRSKGWFYKYIGERKNLKDCYLNKQKEKREGPRNNKIREIAGLIDRGFNVPQIAARPGFSRSIVNHYICLGKLRKMLQEKREERKEQRKSFVIGLIDTGLSTSQISKEIKTADYRGVDQYLHRNGLWNYYLEKEGERKERREQEKPKKVNSHKEQKKTSEQRYQEKPRETKEQRYDRIREMFRAGQERLRKRV